MLAEVAARGGLDAVQAVAEVDLVQIQLEDLLLGVEVLDVRREDDFLQLPAICLVAREEALSRELLRDRAAAFGAPALLKVPQDGAERPGRRRCRCARRTADPRPTRPP